MNWNSPAEFFAMGGYALYVWGSFGACLIAMVAEPLLVIKRRSLILRALRREALAAAIERKEPA